MDKERLKLLKENRSGWDRWRAGRGRAEVNFQGADLNRAELSGVDLCDADLRGAYLRRAQLLHADLSGACCRRADLTRAELSGADLIGTDFRNANLTAVNLSRADLSGADMRGADLTNADLSSADLSRVDLSGAVLIGADLSRAVVDDTIVRETRFGMTILTALDLNRFVSLGKAKHNGPSSVGTDTLARTTHGLAVNRSRQREIEIFLRSAGVGDRYIDVLRDSIGKPE